MRVNFFPPIIILVLVSSFVLFAGCVNGSVESKSLSIVAEPTNDEINSVIAANNQFGFDLYRNLKNDPENSQKNILFSPLSISSAMAIASEGARGKTADEIQTVFHFPNNGTILRQGYSNVFRTVKANNDNDTALQPANALWAEKTYPFLPDYIQTADQFYDAKTTNLDIKNDPVGSIETINQWVKEKTNGKIINLLSQADIDPKTTSLIITNALFFSGIWVKKFGQYDTTLGKFRISPNETVDVQMMFRSYDAGFNYAETSDTQVIELPYRNTTGHQISMLVILPATDDIQKVENSLDVKELNQIRQSLQYQKLGYVIFPKFSLESRYSLPKTLGLMGMPTAFTRDADFSGMDGYPENLYIDDVIHKTFIDVNEDGTQAAASTAVSMKSQGAIRENTIFNANHPFIFIIQDRETGTIFFMGRVMNPNG